MTNFSIVAALWLNEYVIVQLVDRVERQTK